MEIQWLQRPGRDIQSEEHRIVADERQPQKVLRGHRRQAFSCDRKTEASCTCTASSGWLASMTR